MNCQIPYINNTVNNSSINDKDKQKTIELATEAHRFLVKQIIEDGVTTKINNRLYLKSSYIDDPVFKELLLTRGWNEAVKINDETVNDKKQQYLSFNVSNCVNISFIEIVPIRKYKVIEIFRWNINNILNTC